MSVFNPLSQYQFEKFDIIIIDHQNRNQIFLCGDNANIYPNCFGDHVLEVLMPLLKAIIGNGLFDQPHTVDSDVANLFLNCLNKALNLGYLT